MFTVMLTVLISDLFMPLSFASDDHALDGNARSIARANTVVDFGKYPLGHRLIGRAIVV